MKWIEKNKPFVLPIQSISAKKPLLLAIHLQYIVVSNFSWSADNVNVYQYQSCNGIEDRNILQMPCIFTKISKHKSNSTFATKKIQLDVCELYNNHSRAVKH